MAFQAVTLAKNLFTQIFQTPSGVVTTPFPRLFQNCNNPPTDAERATIHAHVRDLEESIEQAGIKGLPMVGHVVVKPESLRLHRCLLSGIRDLPREVLELIFLEVVESPGGDRHRDLWSLTATCALWRQVLLVFPQAWAHLPPLDSWNRTLHDTTPNDVKQVKRIQGAIELYLVRSGECPITFKFHPPKLNPGRIIAGHFGAILTRLVSQAYRWENVDLCISYNKITEIPSLQGRLPLLRSLVLKISFAYPDPLYKPASIEHFSECPRLRHASLFFDNNCQPRLLPPYVNIPWTQLESYEDNQYDDSEFKRVIVKSAPSGAIKVIMFSGLIGDLTRQLSQFEPSSLTALELRIYGPARLSPEPIQWISRDATLPFLEHFACDLPLLYPSHAHSFIERSGCQLKSLDLLLKNPLGAPNGSVESGVMLSDVLGLCSDLEVLRVDMYSSLPSRMDLIRLDEIRLSSSGERSPSLVPNLQALQWIAHFPHRRLGLGKEPDPAWRACNVAFARMAKARFELGPEASPPEITVRFTGFNKQICREILHDLVCANIANIKTNPATHLSLEQGSGSQAYLNSPMLSQQTLERWYDSLRKIPLNLCYPPHRQGIVSSMLSFKGINDLAALHEQDGQVLHQVIEELERYPIGAAGFESIALLHKFEIPTLLRLCAESPSSNIPCSSTYKFPRRIGALRETWDKVLPRYPEIGAEYRRWKSTCEKYAYVLTYAGGSGEQSGAGRASLRFEDDANTQ